MKTVSLFSETAREYGREFLKGVAQYALEHKDWRLRLISPEDIGGRNSLHGVDGVISRVADYNLMERMLASGIPVVDSFCQKRDPMLIGVDSDHSKIGRMAAAYFLQRGFQNFAYCGYQSISYSDLRSAAFSRAIADAGYECLEFSDVEHATNAIFFNEKTKPPRNARRLASWLSSLPPRTAVFCANDLRAYHVLRICQDIGRDIPRDIAVLGVDNDTILCSYASIALSSIDPNAFGIGYAAAKILDAAMCRREKPKNRRVFHVKPGTLKERESTSVYPVDSEWFEKALLYVEANVDKQISLPSLAKIAGVSERTLQNAFQHSFGTSAGKYIMSLKMRKAKTLVESGKFMKKEIAYMLGFSSPQHFCRVFSEYFRS